MKYCRFESFNVNRIKIMNTRNICMHVCTYIVCTMPSMYIGDDAFG